MGIVPETLQRCIVCDKLRLVGKTGWVTMDAMSEQHAEALVDMDAQIIHCDSCSGYDEDAIVPAAKDEPKKRKKKRGDDDDGLDPKEGQLRPWRT